MRKWMLWGIVAVLLLGLSACGGKKEDTPASTPTPNPVETVQVETPVVLSHDEPGLQTRGGLTVLRTSAGEQDGTLFFFAEVRNDSGQILGQVDSSLYPLDEYGVRLTQLPTSPLITDIPPSQVFYVGGSFPAPDLYADSKRFIWYTATAQPSLDAYFNLPTTITERGPASDALYHVSGTATNTSGHDLLFPVIDVVLSGPDGDLVGLAHAVVATSSPDGSWLVGETVAFEALYHFVAVAPELVNDAAVLAVGYAIPQPGE